MNKNLSEIKKALIKPIWSDQLWVKEQKVSFMNRILNRIKGLWYDK